MLCPKDTSGSIWMADATRRVPTIGCCPSALFCWRFSFVVGAAIYIGGSDNKQQSYRGQNKNSLFVGLFARAIMRDGL